MIRIFPELHRTHPEIMINQITVWPKWLTLMSCTSFPAIQHSTPPPNPCLCALFYKISKFLSVPWDTVGHCTSIFILPGIATLMKSSFPALHHCCLFYWHMGTGGIAWSIGTKRVGASSKGSATNNVCLHISAQRLATTFRQLTHDWEVIAYFL